MRLWKFLFGPNFSYLDIFGLVILSYFYMRYEWPPLVLGVAILAWFFIVSFMGAFFRPVPRWRTDD